jgi:ADP-ribose pyrophosphatase YjhB (NUDIX family)
MTKKDIDNESGKTIDKSVINTVTIDCVIFGFDNGTLEILLVQHAEGTSKGKWGLPGGWIKKTEDIDTAALRILATLTGLDNIYLEQLKAFGERNRFPLSRVITIGYYALVKRGDCNIIPGDTATAVRWCKIDELPELIFDHKKIIDYSIFYLRHKVRQEPIGFSMLPKKFTLYELMRLYEEILGYEMDKSNFRRKFLKMKLLKGLEERQTNVSHRAAQLYEFDQSTYEKLMQKGFNFEF